LWEERQHYEYRRIGRNRRKEKVDVSVDEKIEAE